LLDRLIGWQLQSKEACSAGGESGGVSLLVQLDRVVLDPLFFLKGKPCSAPDESEIADLVIIREAIHHLPESLDHLMSLRAMSVGSDLLETLHRNLIHANYFVFKEFPVDHSQELAVESLVDSCSERLDLKLALFKPRFEGFIVEFLSIRPFERNFSSIFNEVGDGIVR